MKKKLVIFDFDGTLTKKDSMLEFARFYHGNFRFVLGMIFMIPIMIMYKINIISNWYAKEIFLMHFFRNESLVEFQQTCDTFALEKIPSFIKSPAMQKLIKHRDAGHQLVIVSSSAENWLHAWCQNQNITLIATRLEISEGCITGRLLGPNCYGPEKVIRLKEKFDVDEFDEIIVYGDSRGDYEMYGISTEHFHKHFN